VFLSAYTATKLRTAQSSAASLEGQPDFSNCLRSVQQAKLALWFLQNPNSLALSSKRHATPGWAVSQSGTRQAADRKAALAHNLRPTDDWQTLGMKCQSAKIDLSSDCVPKLRDLT